MLAGPATWGETFGDLLIFLTVVKVEVSEGKGDLSGCGVEDFEVYRNLCTWENGIYSGSGFLM